VPLLVNVVLFSVAIVWAWTELGALMAWMTERLPDWLDFLAVLLVPLFGIAVLAVVFYGFSIVANLIAAPFNGLLSAAIERRLGTAGGEGPADPGPTSSAVLREVGSSIASEGQKLAYFLPRALGLLALHFVPGVNALAPFLWLAFAAWMLALEYADYPMSNHGFTFAGQRPHLRRWRLTTFGFGGLVALALLVPLLNLFVMPAAVAGATLMWHERVRLTAGSGPATPPAA
jgi:CysZ protein